MRVRGAIVVAGLVIAGCSSAKTVPSPAGPREVSVNVGPSASALPGTLTLPPGKGPFPGVVLVSGSGPTDRDETIGPNKPFRDLALGLAAHGVASVRYDKRTLVDKRQIGAELATFTPTEEYMPDALAAVDLLHHRSEIGSVFVLGHSQGGTFAPRIVQKAGTSVAGLIMMAPGTEKFGADLVRQVTYIAQAEHASGPQLAAEIGTLRQEAARMDNPNLAPSTPTSDLYGGLGPPYWLDLTHYDPIATARSVPQPILVVQGDRDYQVTVADDLTPLRNGLAGRAGVTIKEYARADHLFLDGDAPSVPAEYQTPGHMDAQVIIDIAAWVNSHR